MSSPFGLRNLGAAHPGRHQGWGEDGTLDLGNVACRSCTTPAGGRGRLGLEGEHREVADLIRRSELLAVGGDERALHDTAQRVVQTLQRHIDKERPRFERVETAQLGRLLAGQEEVLGCATRFASNPTPDVGADLLALLVRQADTEDAAVCAEDEEQPGNGGQFEFPTDWAITPPLVGWP